MHKVKCKIDLGKDGWVGNSLWCKYIINDQWAKQNGQGSPTYDWKHSLFSRIKARNSILSHLSFGILFPASPHPACVVQPSPSVILKLMFRKSSPFRETLFRRSQTSELSEGTLPFSLHRRSSAGATLWSNLLKPPSRSSRERRFQAFVQENNQKQCFKGNLQPPGRTDSNIQGRQHSGGYRAQPGPEDRPRGNRQNMCSRNLKIWSNQIWRVWARLYQGVKPAQPPEDTHKRDRLHVHWVGTKLQQYVSPHQKPKDTVWAKALCVHGMWTRLYLEVKPHYIAEDTLWGETIYVQGMWMRLYLEIKPLHVSEDTLWAQALCVQGVWLEL